MKFVDPFYPTKKEIKEWAYEEDTLEPEQDFNLYITNLENYNLIYDIASDSSCPKKNFFLKCLYLLIGDHVRSKGKFATAQEITLLLEKGSKSKEKYIIDWATRSKDILVHPENFIYDLWCDGGYVKG